MKWSADTSSATFKTLRSADGQLEFMVGDFFALDPADTKVCFHGSGAGSEVYIGAWVVVPGCAD